MLHVLCMASLHFLQLVLLRRGQYSYDLLMSLGFGDQQLREGIFMGVNDAERLLLGQSAGVAGSLDLLVRVSQLLHQRLHTGLLVGQNGFDLLLLLVGEIESIGEEAEHVMPARASEPHMVTLGIYAGDSGAGGDCQQGSQA